MRILVMGAGALGSVAGGFMAKAGHTVHFVGRAPHVTAIDGRRLRIAGIWGDHCVKGIVPHTDAAQVTGEAFDLILVTVKSYDTPDAVEAIRPLVGDDTLVCAYQNGLGNAETIAEAFGWARTVGARAIYGARITAPGDVAVTVIANPTALGVYSPDAPAERVREIVRAMDAAGLPTVFTDDIRGVLWAKVAYNAALNPLSALLDVHYGALPASSYGRAIMDDVIEELYAVAEAMGVQLDPDTPGAYRTLFYEKLVPPTAAHYASMREDFLQHRRTEIDALNGAIARYGEVHGVDCPTNRMLTRLVHARECAYGVAEPG